MPCYLSICIPTCGRLEILKNTLDSIFINCSVDLNDFEVVISDNSENDDLLSFLKSYNINNNIVYSKSNSVGFLNSINALKMGNGHFLKLHNNYTKFTSQGLYNLISFIKSVFNDKPIVFFKNSGAFEISKYDHFDEFIFDLSYWNSWSTGFSIWRSDFLNLCNKDFDNTFPHVSLLLLCSDKSSFLINDNIYFINQEVSGKGGYNLFYTFSVEYLAIMKLAMDNSIISNMSFNKIKNDLFKKFLTVWFYYTKIQSNNYTFDLSGISQSIRVNYGKTGYCKLVILSYFISIRVFLSSLIKRRVIKFR